MVGRGHLLPHEDIETLKHVVKTTIVTLKYIIGIGKTQIYPDNLFFQLHSIFRQRELIYFRPISVHCNYCYLTLRKCRNIAYSADIIRFVPKGTQGDHCCIPFLPACLSQPSSFLPRSFRSSLPRAIYLYFRCFLVFLFFCFPRVSLPGHDVSHQCSSFSIFSRSTSIFLL